MGPINDVYNWGSVKALYATVSSMNLAGLIAVVFAIVWAVRFQRGFGDYLNLVAPGDGYVWTTVIISAAVLCTPAYILGLRSCSHLRMESSKADPEEEQTVDELQRVANRLLFFHVIACLLSGFLVAVLNATYLALLTGFQQKSRDGLMQAIQRYGSDATVKERVDAVQTEFECCGDSGYEDWFRVPWLELAIEGPEHTENGPRLEEQSAPDNREEESTRAADVPFSCCSIDIPKPCVHHDILNPSAAYDYDPKHPTIATLGCRTKIMDRAVTVRIFLSGYLVVVTVYQVTLSFLSRLLQTAHSNDLYIGFRKPQYRAWILFSPKRTSSEAALLKRNSRTSRSRERFSRKPLLSLNTTTTASSSSSSSSFCSLEEEEAAPKAARKAKSSGVKMLDEIRSKISSAKSKSLPVLVESKTSIANELRVPKRDVHLLNHGVDGGAGRRRDENKRRRKGSKRFSEHATRSEVVVRPNYDSSELSPGSRSIYEDLPPPPPPPPFVPRFEAEQEDAALDNGVIGALREQRSFGQNSGRRAKVLERFGKIERKIEGRAGCYDRVAQHRESGGADFVKSDSSVGSDRSNRMKSSPGDVYDRFRGSLQHTLARRETARSRRGSGRRARGTRATSTLEARRSSLLARLGCKNVPPSYRLLANLEDKKRPRIQTYLATRATATSFPQNAWSADCGATRIRCSVCHCPVRQNPTSSRGSFVERDHVVTPINDFLENRSRSREISVCWNRGSPASMSVLRR